MTAGRSGALSACAACLIAGCGGIAAPPVTSLSAPLPSPAQPVTVGSALAAQQTLARGLDDMPRSLDPLLVNDVPGQRVSDDLFEGLTTVAIDGKAAPGVASSWESRADGRTWTASAMSLIPTFSYPLVPNSSAAAAAIC